MDSPYKLPAIIAFAFLILLIGSYALSGGFVDDSAHPKFLGQGVLQAKGDTSVTLSGVVYVHPPTHHAWETPAALYLGREYRLSEFKRHCLTWWKLERVAPDNFVIPEGT